MKQPSLVQLLSDQDLVIWDWNGTLLNDVDHAVECMNFILADHALPQLDKTRYQQIFDFPIRKYYDALGFNYVNESFEALCHRFVDRFMAGFAELPLVNGMLGVLEQLQALGIRQSVLSATDQPNLDAMIEHYKLGGFFTHVCGIQDKFASSKVQRGHELMEMCRADRTRTVIVGDTLHDLEVARELGIGAVLVGHGHQCHSRLKQSHDNVWISDNLPE